MGKLLVRALILSGVLVLGMLIGVVGGRLPVFASFNPFQSNPPTKVSNGDYCHFYEMTLANDLHVSTSQLEQANKDALQKTIDQLADTGKITLSEQVVLEAALQQYGSDPCTNLPKAVAALMSNPALKQQLTQIHTKLVNDVAKSLNLAPATLETDLAQGQTIPQLAQQQKVALADVNAAYLKSVKTILSQYVQNETITQDQADLLYGLVAQAVSNGHYPLLEPLKK
jgi:hypothetical protein